MVRKERCEDSDVVGFLKLKHKVSENLTGVASDVLQSVCHLARAGCQREAEEAVYAACVVLAHGLVVAQPGFAHYVAVALDCFCLLIQEGQEIDALLCAVGVEAGNGIKSEAIDSDILKPELHDVFNLFTHIRAIEIKIGHGSHELAFVVPGASRDPLEALLLGLREVVVVSVFSAGLTMRDQVLAGCLEPGMVAGGMVDHQVDYDVDPHRVRPLHEVSHVVQRSELGIDVIVVFDIVLVIATSHGNRHEPDSVETHILDVGELLGYSVQISYAVVVRVVEGPDEDLVVVAVFVVDRLYSHGQCGRTRSGRTCGTGNQTQGGQNGQNNYQSTMSFHSVSLLRLLLLFLLHNTSAAR